LVFSNTANEEQKIPLKTLKPGESQAIEISQSAQNITVKLMSPTGFNVIEKKWEK
jgi:hypothetical protein